MNLELAQDGRGRECLIIAREPLTSHSRYIKANKAVYSWPPNIINNNKNISAFQVLPGAIQLHR